MSTWEVSTIVSSTEGEPMLKNTVIRCFLAVFLASFQGDINKKQKTCHRLKQQIQEITRCQSKANTKLKEEIAAIEGDIQNLNATGQVGSRFKTKYDDSFFQLLIQNSQAKVILI